MLELPDEQFERFIVQYDKRDPDLARELRAKRASRELGIPGPAELHLKKAVVTARPEREAVRRGPAIYHDRTAETIVRPNARPVMEILDNHITGEFHGPISEVWGHRVLAAKEKLDKVIPAVGRVEVNNNPDYQWLGTGWLVAEDMIVTNRHVAREFGRLGPTGFTFRLGVNGGPQSARLDFLEEYGRTKSAEFAVTAILWIASPSDPDVAFLRVSSTSGGQRLPSPLVLADHVDADEFVATIGYPAKDPNLPDQELVKSIFGDVYEKKRLAPGQIMEVRAEELEHDCSTLPGNSGSPLVRLSTGEIVGLHFSGAFLTANYAVPAPKIKELLGKVQRQELPGTGPLQLEGGNDVKTPEDDRGSIRDISSSAQGAAQSGGTAPGSYTVRLNLPIEITIRVGGVGPAPGDGSGRYLDAGAASGGGQATAIEAAVTAARQALKGHPEVVEVRAGYRFKRGWITGERVVVVEVRKKVDMEELRASGKAPIPPQFQGVGVDVRTAALADQLEHFGVNLEALEAPPRPGSYREPNNIPLDRVNEPMKAIFHSSPDSGFPNLSAFLARVRKQLTATMYEWVPNHISDAIEQAMKSDGRLLRMVTQMKGTEEAIADMRTRLGDNMQHVWASVGSGRLFPSAYHIKVASRDGEEVWVSSGNWKESNQPNIDPVGENSNKITPLRKYNREWHAILSNEKLATMFQQYIEWDFQEAERVPVEEMPAVALPDLFVPDEALLEAPEAPLRAKYFPPLELDKQLDIQPLLTPDRDDRGRRIFISTAVAMMRRAQRSLFVENQSFNVLPENVDEFEEFFIVLREKQQAGLDVRVIFRDPREFGSSGGAKLQKMLETIRDFGIDTDKIKVQRHCHTKGIIVDDQEVLLGSHNLTNAGSLYNRDASLLVRDPQVADYFKKIFEFDWDTLAVQQADEMVADVRVAMPGEPTPPGFRRVTMREAVGES
jgi:V8-like Glu-specific endopeptidase